MKKIEQFLSEMLDNLSEYIANRKGLLPLLGVIFVILNFLFVLIFPESFIGKSDLMLHLGIILAIFGLVLARAL